MRGAEKAGWGRRLRTGIGAAVALLAVGLQVPVRGEVLDMAIGVTAKGSPIHAGIAPDALRPDTQVPSILVVAGLDGRDESVSVAAALLRETTGSPFLLSVVLNAFPDREPAPEFPPSGPSYGGHSVESQYLWRFLGLLAPDLVVDLRTDEAPSPLVEALTRGAQPAGVGRIPAATLRFGPAARTLPELQLEAAVELERLAADLQPSGARRELRARVAREPMQTALLLEKAYGHSLDSATYIPALALIGRLRLGDLEGTSRLPEIERLVAPFLRGKPSLGNRPSGSHLSGHLVFAELHERTGTEGYLQLARAAADLGFGADGSPKASMPYHNEMSDAVFMGCAILARTGRLTGEGRYFRMALRHLRFIQALDLRPDGLYRHSPLDHAAWGRGNGFPALGLALALSDWPPGEPGHAEVLASLRSHLRALARHQDPTGAWHQVVDRPESYREFSSTAMIGFAVTRGLRRGWIDRGAFGPIAEGAWDFVQTRIKADGTLVDVCRSTWRQDSLRDYFDREALLGRDDRGGAMGLLLATERAAWVHER